MNDYLTSSCTYAVKLNLKRDNLTFTAGFCLSQIGLDALAAIKENFLHPKELHYFSNLQHTKRQYSYLLGRYCAKQAISLYLENIKEKTVLIEPGVFQQPVVIYPSQNMQVSITHTDQLGAALAFSEAHPMAIDIETICENKTSVIQTQITSHEEKFFSTSSLDTTIQMTLLWTAKEALSKVLRCGFMIPFDLLAIEKVTEESDHYISYFKNFTQYKALSFQLDNSICSLVYPKNSHVTFCVLSIKKMFQRNSV